MNENEVKIRLKIGQMEVEYEGTESFLKNDLSNLLDKVTSFLGEHNTTQRVESSIDSTEIASSTDRDRKIDLSMTTIASRVDANTGPDLARATAVHLTLIKKKESFSRTEILEMMKEAKGHYKASVGSNLTTNLRSPVKNKRLNETASGTYALAAGERDEMEQLLA